MSERSPLLKKHESDVIADSTKNYDVIKQYIIKYRPILFFVCIFLLICILHSALSPPRRKHAKYATVVQLRTSPQDGVWQPVTGTKYRFYVYSAYVERRNQVRAIRVIGATKTISPDKVYCLLWVQNKTLKLRAHVKAIREHWSLEYSAVFIICSFTNATKVPIGDTVGSTLAIVARAPKNASITNYLRILDTAPPSMKEIQQNLHVCVKPFHFFFGNDDWTIEWIELNRLLGVSHFYMYNKTMSERTTCIIQHYQREYGLITLRPWNLPIVSVTEIRTQGLFAAFNDCLYRSMKKAAWLLVIDLDEIVFPRKVYTLLELLQEVVVKFSPLPLSMMFQNAFFFTFWKDDPAAPAPLLTARKTRKLRQKNGPLERSKYVVRPRETIELGNHFVWKGMTDPEIYVNASDALMHHYRNRWTYNESLKTSVDRSAHRYSIELERRVREEKKLIVQSCPKYFH